MTWSFLAWFASRRDVMVTGIPLPTKSRSTQHPSGKDACRNIRLLFLLPWSRRHHSVPGRNARRGQYPTGGELVLGEEPDPGAAPETVTSCHSPPKPLTPLPLFCPAAVSPLKVYSGCPS